MNILFSSARRWLMLVILALFCLAFYFFDLYEYLSFETVKAYQLSILAWTSVNYTSAVLLYFLLFTLLIACAIPCATVLTLIGGFLFGNMAVAYAILSTTFGGLILFLVIRKTIGTDLAASSKPWIQSMAVGFQENAFNYLLTLRLVPIFPCWISNIGAGALNVPIKTFISATMLGITPATIIYVLAGKSLDRLLLADESALSNILLTPSVLFPLLGLAVLSLFPVIYKRVKKD